MKGKKTFSLVLSLLLVFSCFAILPMTVSAVSNGIFMAKLDYSSGGTYIQNEINLEVGVYQLDIDYRLDGSATRPYAKIQNSGGQITRNIITEENGHYTAQFTVATAGSHNVFLAEYGISGIIYYANPVLKKVEDDELTGDNLLWDFSKQYANAGSAVTNTYAWGGQWYKSSSGGKFTIEKDGRDLFSTSDKGASYVAKLNYKAGDTYTYLRTEMNLTAGTYQFDVDYVIKGDTSLYAGVDNAATKISAVAEDGHMTMLFTASGGALGIKLSDANFTSANVIYLANPVLKLVEGGIVTGNNLVWDFSKQFSDAGASVTTDYGWAGKWYKSNDSANAVFTVERDIYDWFPARNYIAKLNYTDGDTWTYLRTEMNLDEGTYQLDVDYVIEGDTSLYAGVDNAATKISAVAENGHMTMLFTASGGALGIKLSDANFTSANVIYLANPVLKKLEDDQLTGNNLVYDFYKQFAFAGGTVTTAYGWGGQWYKSNDSARATFTVGVDDNGIFERAAHNKHVFDEGVVTNPTCTEGGYTTYTCTVCGYSYQDNETTALGHNFADYVGDNNATCTADGTKTAKCTRCEATDTIPDAQSALGHDFGKWAVTKAATCTEKGAETRVCSRDSSHTETREIAATGHKKAAAVKENVKAATYTKAGSYDSVVYCSVCKSEISRKTVAVAMKVGTFKITYKLNSGKNNSANPATFKTNKAVTLKNPTRKGYKFAGWYTNAKFTGKKVTSIAKGTAKNITLYAKWTKVTYKITYKLNNGKNNAKNPKSYNVTTKTITLKNATRKGYTFKGWYLDSKFKKKVTKIAKGSTGNKTLYAKWAKKK